MLKVKVNRKKWYRGKGPAKSSLLCSNGQMCCIGFLGKALDVKNAHMLKQPTLHDATYHKSMSDSVRHVVTEMVDEFDYELSRAYQINDDPEIEDDEREVRLKKIGKSMDVVFTFIN